MSLLRLTLIAFTLAPCGVSIADEPWIDLLGENHRDLWRGYKTESWPAGWEFADGVLTRKEGGDDIMTVAQYADFDFRFEWKISPEGNSGVLYRVSTGDDAPYYSGPEYQILDNKADPDGPTSNTSASSLYGLYGPPEDLTKPVGEWNTGRIVVRGGHIEHWVNGKKVVDCEIGSDDWKERLAASKFINWPKFAQNREGHISLQDHGAPVSFRTLRIRALAEKANPAKE